VTPPVATPSARTHHALNLFAGLPSDYERAAKLLSLGQDGRWRRSMVSRLRVPAGGRVLDVATGTGLVAEELVRRTAASVVGLDHSEPMIRNAVSGLRDRPEAGGRVVFVLGDGQRLPFRDAAFDGLTFTYLLRYVDDPGGTLHNLARVVKPGGMMANLEFHVPPNVFWRWMWRLYTRVGLPVAGRAFSRRWYDVGRFLGPSIEDLYRRHPLSEQLDMWRAAGIRPVQARVMSLGGGVVIWGRKAEG
jgi:demethylmenaquinone methyltransferase / 2-methoxy-6-polyprenyl-1,4-benzoquinol methylase